MNRCAALLMVMIIMAVTGCSAPEKDTGNSLTPVVTQAPAPIPLQSTYPSVTSPTEAPAVPATTTVRPTITPEKTAVPVAESALKAHIQDAKNQLDMLKNSDKADTIVLSVNQGMCEIKMSRELGYLIDVNSGEMSYVKGDYGSISLDLFRRNMTTGHSYIILHTHAKDWYLCGGRGIVGLDTFSLADLAVASNLTRQGYHVQKVIAVSDKDYEVYPKIRDNWETGEEVYQAVDHLEQRMEVKFSTYDPYLNQTFYDVDNLMPLLTKELNYTYTINNVVLT